MSSPPPLYAHRLDIPEAYEAATRIGRMLVCDKIGWPGIVGLAKRWAKIAHKATGVDALGAENRFCWAVTDAAHAFGQQQHEMARAIKSMLRPMIARHDPWNVLMAEGHELNGSADFPLDEETVTELVRTEVYFSLPPAPRRLRHG